MLSGRSTWDAAAGGVSIRLPRPGPRPCRSSASAPRVGRGDRRGRQSLDHPAGPQAGPLTAGSSGPLAATGARGGPRQRSPSRKIAPRRPGGGRVALDVPVDDPGAPLLDLAAGRQLRPHDRRIHGISRSCASHATRPLKSVTVAEVAQLVDGSHRVGLNALSRTLFLAIRRRERAIDDIRVLAPPLPVPRTSRACVPQEPGGDEVVTSTR
jgi:hypothetical protein